MELVFAYLNQKKDPRQADADLRQFRRALVRCGLPGWNQWETPVKNMVREAYHKRCADKGYIRTLVIALKGMYPTFGPRKLTTMVAVMMGFSALLSEAMGIQMMIQAEASGAPKFSEDD